MPTLIAAASATLLASGSAATDDSFTHKDCDDIYTTTRSPLCKLSSHYLTNTLSNVELFRQWNSADARFCSLGQRERRERGGDRFGEGAKKHKNQ